MTCRDLVSYEEKKVDSPKLSGGTAEPVNGQRILTQKCPLTVAEPAEGEETPGAAVVNSCDPVLCAGLALMGRRDLDCGSLMPRDASSSDFLCSDFKLSRELFNFDLALHMNLPIQAVSGKTVFLIIN